MSLSRRSGAKAGRKGAAIHAAAALALMASASAVAQVNLTGYWVTTRQQDSSYDQHVGETVGIPWSAEGLRRIETWDASIYSLPEWQCRPHSSAYNKRGPSAMRIWEELDPISREPVAIQFELTQYVNTPVYMDGRPHPPKNAAHTWGGFQTGTWEGERLKIKTTHLKENYHRRNGGAASDLTTNSEYIIRREFDGEVYLTSVHIAYDPVYLTEPLPRAVEYVYRKNLRIPPYPCNVVTEIDRPVEDVPHYLPGQNPQITAFVDYYGLPKDAWRDGAATLYPEYRQKLGEHAKSTHRTHTGRPQGLLGP